METDQTNITFDLGILTMFDSKPLTYKYDANDTIFPEKLQEQSLQNIKKIVHALHALKVKKDQAFEAIPDEHQVIDFGQSQYDVNLPEVTTIFPRHKKLPEQKALTKWERFAQDKGIEKRKRSRMVYDEITKTFVPRWGARSIKKIQNQVDIIREVKPGENPNEDPFEKKSQVKKLQKEKQKYNELRNKMEAKGMLKKGVPDTITNTHNKKHKDGKAASRTLQIAQNSTASMGMFDKKAHKEEPEMKKKRKNNPTTFKSAKDENRRDLDILQQVAKNQGSQRVGK